MVFRKPHSVSVHAVSNDTDGIRVAGTTYASFGVLVACNLQPMSSEKAFEKFGPSITADWILFAETDLESAFANGTLVVYGARRFRVSARPLVWNSGLPTDHIEVALHEQQFKEEPS